MKLSVHKLTPTKMHSETSVQVEMFDELKSELSADQLAPDYDACNI